MPPRNWNGCSSGRRMLWQDSASESSGRSPSGRPPAPSTPGIRSRLEELLDQPVIIELDQELPKPCECS